MGKEMIRIGFIGNPNCGKTTLFNAYTGSTLKTANWPGVTVEKKEGRTVYREQELCLIDLPGIYSLQSYTMEEKVASDCLERGEVDVLIQVADATSLERSLYLTLELLERDIPLVLALNMMDLAVQRGIQIDRTVLEKELGIPVVCVSAKRETGLEELLHRAVYERSGVPKAAAGYGSKERYTRIKTILGNTLQGVPKEKEQTDKLDDWLLNRWTGMPLFLLIMALVFFLTFTLGDVMKHGLEQVLTVLMGEMNNMLVTWDVDPAVRSLIVEGILSGVGGILVFLPNIGILFLLLALLEDSGYLPRVAVVMSGIMEHVGLSGRAVLPLLLGFGCTVPAVMASRVLESEKDRFRTILITPFMSCGARLPIYILFSGMFFPGHEMQVCYSLYLFGLATGLFTAWMLARGEEKEGQGEMLLELPEYRVPTGKAIFFLVWEKVKDYLKKAGTVIFLASMVMWVLMHFGKTGYVTEAGESAAAWLGNLLVPFFRPIGLGYWQLIAALISGIAAKEVVVSSCGVLFGIAEVTTKVGMQMFCQTLQDLGFGPVNSLSMMTFSLLYLPCTASIAVMRRETGSTKKTAAMLFYQLAAAWIVSFLVYQFGTVLGYWMSFR